ncbi:MAG: SprT family zinc-dependent metalloprotease [Minisyncoccia bacterium]
MSINNLDSIQYKLRQSLRAKRMKISVFCDGRVVVTVPRNFNNNLLQKFLFEKKAWISEKVRKFLKSPMRFVHISTKKDFLKYKNEVQKLVEERLSFFNQTYGLKYNKITIRNQKSRWGSCSRKGNLNFNYKIKYLPAEVRDYVIVHELCHLKEFNHSKDFWKLVSMVIPEYKEMRRKLKSG